MAGRLRTRVASIGGGASLFPLLVLFGLNAVDELDRTAFQVLLPEIKKAFDLGNTGATALAAAIVPAGLVFGIPVAYLADRRRRVPIAVAGASAWAVFSLLTGLAPGVLALGAARIGAGLGRAVNDPVHGSLLSDYYAPGVRAKVFGTHRAANSIGAFLGPVSAGLIAQSFGWRVPFFVLAAPTVALLLFAASLPEPPRTGRSLSGQMPRFSEGVRLLWRVPTLRRIWLAVPFLATVVIVWSFVLALYYEEVFGLGPGARGLVQSLDAPFIVAGFLIGTPLIDRGIAHDPARTMRAIAVVAGSIAVFIAGLAAAPSLWAAIPLAYATVTLAAVLTAGGTAVISLVAPPEVRASAFAFYGVFALAGVLALPVIGIVSDAYSLRWGFGVLPPFLLAGCYVLFTASRSVEADIRAVNEAAGPD